MITLIFWNIAKNPVCLEHLPCLAQTHKVDLFILAECPDGVNLEALNALGQGRYQRELNANAKVQAITRLDSRAFIHRYTSLGREMAVWSTVISNAFEILVAGVHLTSKFGGTTDADQTVIASEVIAELNQVEDRQQHRYGDDRRLQYAALRSGNDKPHWGAWSDDTTTRRSAGPQVSPEVEAKFL